MIIAPFARFRSVIAAASEAAIRADVTLGGKLLLAQEGRLSVAYAPFEHVVPTARVVIVGITPGVQQATNALVEARRQTLAGADDAAALAEAKIHGSFSGAMRDGLVRMLDHVGLHERLGIATCASLWSSHAHLAHFTSALRYPVLLDDENYNGSPSMTRTSLLRELLEGCLAQEARTLPDALWIPCGGTAAEGLDWIVRQGLLDPERVCLGMPHPSPANAERVQYFLGTGRERSALSPKTDPDRIEQARAAMVAKVARLGTSGSTSIAGASMGAPMARPAPEPRPAAKFAGTRRTEPRVPSKLGLAIEAAVDADPRFVVHQPERLYQCTYRTRVGGTVFAFERTTEKAINMWLPATSAVASAAAKAGIVVPNVSRPYPDPGKPERYGRLSTLAYVPELKDADLLPIKVASEREALAVLSALA